jgi:hypothetical protein
MERGLMLVFSNPTSPDVVDEFNQWYSETHVHELLAVAGVVGATRYELDEDQMMPGDDADGRHFLAAYEIEAPDLKIVRDAVMATSGDRSHSPALELDPLPRLMIFRQLGPRVEG